MRHLIISAAIFALILNCWGFQGVARAQSEENANRMAEIVVSAEPLGGSEAAGTVHRITARQIRRQGARTLDEALQLIPGVTIREGAQGTPRIDIRGFRTRHVQLFINGIPIRETFDDQFDPTTIPVEYIAEIKVTTGGASVLYGQGGNGGAIDIITKKGVQGIQGSIGAEAGTGDRCIGEMNAIRQAQIFRGAGLLREDLKRPRCWPDWLHCLLVPTLVRALSLAADIALAATARDFGIHKQRTHWPGDAL